MTAERKRYTIVIDLPENVGDSFDAYIGDDAVEVLSGILASELEWVGIDYEIISITEQELNDEG